MILKYRVWNPMSTLVLFFMSLPCWLQALLKSSFCYRLIFELEEKVPIELKSILATLLSLGVVLSSLLKNYLVNSYIFSIVNYLN